MMLIKVTQNYFRYKRDEWKCGYFVSVTECFVTCIVNKSLQMCENMSTKYVNCRYF